MPKKYQENTTNSPIWVSGVMIPPGEGREVEVADEAQVVEEAPADEDPDDALRELLAGNVASVKASLAGLSEATLQRLQAMEAEAEKPRKGVQEALADALIAIADEKLTSDDLGQDKGEGGGEGGDDAGGDTNPNADAPPAA
jgi:hypothetical protein